MLKRIGAEESGEFKAVASGTLPCGKPVVVNADGTVSVVGETTITKAYGSVVTFTTSNTNYQRVAYDSSNNKIVIAYDDDSDNTGKAVVGTVNASNNSISFGTPVTFNNAQTEWIDIEFDSNANKFVIGYQDDGNSSYGTAIVGTVSGTSISFGSEVVFLSNYVSNIRITFDTTANKIIIAYIDQSSPWGRALVGTVSGTSISFGSAATFDSDARAAESDMVYDANANKIVIAYQLPYSSGAGKAVIGTVSGTSISFGTPVTFDAGQASYPALAYNSVDKNVILAYRDSYSSGAKAVVGTVSGTSISFGSVNTVASTSGIFYIALGYNPQTNTVALEYGDTGNSNYGTIFEGTISGTTISFDSGTVFQESRTQWSDMVYDSSADRLVLTYEDYDNSGHGKSMVIKTGGVTKNLTSENYIGMSRGVVNVTSQTESIGSASVFESADTTDYSVVFDSNSNKIVIAYMDRGNSNYGTAIVGTVSGTSISFGSPTVFKSAESTPIKAVFDSSNNKIVISYKASTTGSSIVGTVSGTSISFGSEVTFSSNCGNQLTSAFDSNSNKVVVAFKDDGNSEHGTAKVGTVSGTSISFGSAAVFEAAQSQDMSSTFDSSNNKVIVAYRTSVSKAVVGTVSGTSISFGTAVQYFNGITQSSAAFDSNNNKVVIGYTDGSSGAAVVGTVSGTDISFGSEVTFESGGTSNVNVLFDTSINKIVVLYYDTGNSDNGTIAVGTVSGTSITFETPTVFAAVDVRAVGAGFDSSNNKVVAAYRDGDNSNYGTSVVMLPGFTDITRAEVANSGNASIDIIGSVSENQVSLTAGQQYFVQTDGTIGTTAATPSVLAGTAISATELVVKT